MQKRIFALALATALIATVFAGCGNGGSASSAGSAAESKAEPKSLTLNVGPEPETIDPALNQTVDGGIYILHAFEGLTKLDKDGKTIVNGQAKDIKVSEDKKTYTVTIRDDAKWSDGQPVKASDFVYAWQRAVDPATASPYNYMFDVIENANDIMAKKKTPDTLGAKAVDDKTVEIKLTAPCAYFKELLAFPTYMPLRKDIIDKDKDQWTQKPETYVSNGAYKLQDWSHKESITFVKNPNYYDAKSVVNDTLKFLLLEDDAAILAAYENKDASFVDSVPQAEIDAWKSKPDYHVDPQLGTYFVVFQTQKKPFDDPKVRKALSLAIDRNFIVEQIGKADQIPANAYVPDGVGDVDPSKQFRDAGKSYYSVKAEDYDKNVEEAKKLLSEAGYPNGKGFPSFEYMFNTGTGHQAIAEALQNMWKEKLNINATLSSQEWAVFTDTRQKGNYSVARHGWLGDYNDAISFLDMWVTGGGNNDAKWSNAKYDQLIKDVKATDDNAVRMPKMHEAEDILMDEMPVAPIYFYTDIYLIDPSIKGFYASPLGFKFFTYATKG